MNKHLRSRLCALGKPQSYVRLLFASRHLSAPPINFYSVTWLWWFKICLRVDYRALSRYWWQLMMLALVQNGAGLEVWKSKTENRHRFGSITYKLMFRVCTSIFLHLANWLMRGPKQWNPIWNLHVLWLCNPWPAAYFTLKCASFIGCLWNMGRVSVKHMCMQRYTNYQRHQLSKSDQGKLWFHTAELGVTWVNWNEPPL